MENENVENKVTQLSVKNQSLPNFFVDKNQLQINVYVVYNTLDGNILAVTSNKFDDTFIQGINTISYKFIFTKPNYQQTSRYKQLSMYWDNIAKNTIVNPFKFRNFIILNHLKRWENVKNQLGQDVNLEMDIDNTLTQKSLEIVYSVNPSIIDCVMKQFQKQTNIVF